MSLIQPLLDLAAAYCDHRQLSLSRVSSLVFGDGKVLPELRADKRDITTRRLTRAIAWFSTHWPDGAVWPDHVQRPGPFSPGVDPPVVRPGPDGAQTSAGLPTTGAT